jgi:hypothetical protein
MSAMAVLLRQLIDSVRARVITEPSPPWRIALPVASGLTCSHRLSLDVPEGGLGIVFREVPRSSGSDADG